MIAGWNLLQIRTTAAAHTSLGSSSRPTTFIVTQLRAMKHCLSTAVICAAVIFLGPCVVAAQQNTSVVVQAEADELPSAYGAPPDLSHGRISTLTKSYVLSPFTFEVEGAYTGSIFRHGKPDHLFTQEIEMGLPGRFTVGVQNQIDHFAGGTAERSFTLEARYALANWNKLPLNPAISAEYRFGLADGMGDSGEIALLVSHDFPHLIEWAMNIFIDRDFGGRHSTSGGFAQSIEIPVLLPEEKLEVGLEMQYRSGAEEVGSLRRGKGLQIGPTLAFRPTKELRFDLSPLLGCSDHTPAVQVFAVFSWSFGHSASGESDSPASAHGR